MADVYRPNVDYTLATQVAAPTSGKVAFIPAYQLVDATGAPVGGASTASAASSWNYAGVTGGITDTSDVTVKAAAGAGIRNYMTSIQYANTGVASEIVVKDGSTVIWRGYAPATTGAQSQIAFDPPLRGTANTALNVAMITTASATRVSAQGYTGV